MAVTSTNMCKAPKGNFELGLVFCYNWRMQDTNFTWPQGEDMVVELRYKEGPTIAKALPVNLAGGYSARMSIVNPSTPDTIAKTLSTETGEISLLAGTSGPNIVVRLDRSLTLAGGALVPPISYVYDFFLRNNANEQVKILEGTLHVRRSVTQWA